MRKYFGLALGLALLGALAAQPAFAACTAGGTLSAANEEGTSYIYSNPNWCGSAATYCSGVGPALSPDTRALFWSLSTGDPIVGAGDDNGTFGGNFADVNVASCQAQGEWLCTLFDGGFGFHGPALIAGGWDSSAAVDGCILNNNFGGCTCVLITDSWYGVGYYALASATHNTTGRFSFVQPGDAPLRLEPIPRPLTVSIQRLQPSLDAEIGLRVDLPTSGVYEQDGCSCAPTGFRVRQMILPRNSPPPVDRDAGAWSLPDLASGASQPIQGGSFGMDMADGMTIRSECGMSDNDVYVATELIFPDGFVAPIVSENSGLIHCGPNLAEPEPQRPLREPRDRGGRPEARDPGRRPGR